MQTKQFAGGLFATWTTHWLYNSWTGQFSDCKFFFLIQQKQLSKTSSSNLHTEQSTN